MNQQNVSRLVQCIDVFTQIYPQEAFEANTGIVPWLGHDSFLPDLPMSSVIQPLDAYSLNIDSVINRTNSTASNLCENTAE
jgi:hypothetical protein